ncbi:MrcB family domain-containing protein [Halopelagius longus]|uniref:EVE domain-containing protein n=1 Tax=Halopelagius longus TaxID=1236180 RepID=A0A1H0YT76_9EURY|nr:DUF3578 domain-containing protein [Halopelagius longus]RDI72665.1 EVE domain-containing protein [Halopelagius longus]SDQ18384.1 EVE domain-containing protein [Halopelagius longus]
MAGTPSFGEVLKQILEQYPSPKRIGRGREYTRVNTDEDLLDLVTNKAEQATKGVLGDLDDTFHVRPSMGQGDMSDIPYIPIQIPEETQTTQKGIYVVYLFDTDAETLYLTLNQGATEAQRASGLTGPPYSKEILSRHAESYRSQIDWPNRFTGGPSQLTEEVVLDSEEEPVNRADKYNAGTIVYRAYDIDDLGEDANDTLTKDLIEIVGLYQNLLDILYSVPEFEEDSANVWKISPEGGDDPYWTTWQKEGIASIGFTKEAVFRPDEEIDSPPETHNSPERQAYNVQKEIEEGDIVVAGAPKTKIDVAFGVGRVTQAHFETMAELDDPSAVGPSDFDHEVLISVDWYPFSDHGIAVNCLKEGKKLFHNWTVEEFNAQLDHFVGAVARRMVVQELAENEDTVINETVDRLDLTRVDNGHRDSSTRYFWVNSASESWHREDGEAFYKTTTSEGRQRRNQSAYKQARPGDKVLIYRNAPTQAIVGRGHIEAGLHEEYSETRDESVEGITIGWDDSLEGVDWDQIQSIPQLEGSELIETNNNYVITELSKPQYESILELAEAGGPNYFWMTASPEIWDLESIDKGEEVFYTAYNESGRKRRLYEEFERARPGDRVLFYESSPVQQIVGEGTVAEGLHKEQPEHRNEPVEGITIRYDDSLAPVDWQMLSSLDELKGTTVIRDNARGTLFPLSKRAFEAIRSVFPLNERIEDLRARLSSLNVSVELPDELYYESEADLRRQIQSSLNSGKHIIFTGPPGTGKTKLAKHVSKTVSNQHGDIVDGYRFTTATAEWTTFDTIGGYIPNRSAEGDELVFQPRIFLDCFRKDGSICNEWLVIDEINRSDIDKAFGQLFSVLSGDSVQLPYERESPIEIASLDESTTDDVLESIVTNQDIFPVTPSWRLLATMNTYDKTSLYELSYAFMRRFNFVHVGVPSLSKDGRVRTSLLNPDAEENYGTVWTEADESLLKPLEATYKQLSVIWHRVNKHQTIGPSIVRDMLGYLAASGPSTLEDPGPALTDAVIALVFPQLEGMSPQNQRSLIDSLTATSVQTEAGIVDLTLDESRLKQKAEDFFDLPPRSDE